MKDKWEVQVLILTTCTFTCINQNTVKSLILVRANFNNFYSFTGLKKELHFVVLLA